MLAITPPWQTLQHLLSEAGRKCRPAPAAVLSGAGWALLLPVRALASAFPTPCVHLWRLF